MPAEIDVAIIGAGKLEHLHKAVTTGKASAILAASIFHFEEISIPEAKQCLQERGIPVSVRRT
jgi:cyclase